MRRRSNSLSALLATILSAACTVAPGGPPLLRPEPVAPVAAPSSARGDAPCEEVEVLAPCDLRAGWTPPPRGAWEACRRPA